MDPHLQSIPSTSKKSILLPIGIVLIIIGLFVPGKVWDVATQMRPGTVKALLFISTDLFRLGFFAGIGMTIIGIMRNGKKRSASVAGSQQNPGS